MEFLVVGLNHRTASLEIRERLAVPKAQLPEALHALSARVSQGVILSTCNRSEVYTAGTEDGLKGRVEEFLVDHFGVALEDVDRYLYSYQHEECVRHLFRVSSSLDSMIMGEGQILRQVRDAFEAAAQANTVQAPLSRVFHHALRVGKRVRRDTTIGKNALSVSRACVELARRILGDLSQLRVMVVGTGDAGKLAARALQDSGVKSVVVTNRTFQRAADLVGDLDAQAVPFKDMPHLLGEVDIVVGCTGSPGYVLDAGMVENAIARRPDKPLFLIDIAVPRDIDPDAAEIPNVHLHDVDDLQAISNTNRLERERQAGHAEEIVAQETIQFLEWYQGLDKMPTISALRRRAEDIREQELERLLKRLDHRLTPEDICHLEMMSRALVKKILHAPTAYLKEHSGSDDLRLVRDLFDLDQDAAPSEASDQG